jgi:acetyl esterase/lipase
VTSVALLGLGVAALLALGNAIRPVKSWWAAVLSWPVSLFTIELAPQLMVLNVGTATVLASLGGLRDAAGRVGLAAVLVANACAAVFLARFRHNVVSLEPSPSRFETGPVASRYPRSQAAFPFLVWRRSGVCRMRNVTYASPDGRDLKLDVYAPLTPSQDRRPAIIYVHGGGLVTGTRREGSPMLTHLAANGWVAFSIDYRLSPRATFPDHLIDVKRAVAWVREHAGDYDVDPSFIAISGGSAGAYLVAQVALTAGDATLQPGFADADTSVAALVALYGLYDLLDEPVTYWPGLMRILERSVFKASRTDAPEIFRVASPMHRIHPDAPPALIIYGDHDTLLPADQSRHFAHRLREMSRNPVYAASIAGGQHAFDLVPSWRTIAVVEAIEGFLSDAHRRHQRFTSTQDAATTSQHRPAPEPHRPVADDLPASQSDDHL